MKASKEPSGWHWRLPRDGANAYAVPDEVRRSLAEDAADPPTNAGVAHVALNDSDPEKTGETPPDGGQVRQERHGDGLKADADEGEGGDDD